MAKGELLLERMEILSEELFDSHRAEMDLVEQFQSRFATALGWHYLLDLAWIIREIRTSLPPGSLLLDAGAGNGILQFLLAELGYNVISADFTGRGLPGENLRRYRGMVHSLNSQKSSLDNRYTRHLASVYGRGGGCAPAWLARLFCKTGQSRGSLEAVDRFRFLPRENVQPIPFEGDPAASCGRIFLYRCDLKEMPLIPDGFADAVVSLSALEHNDHPGFASCMDELLRVTKRGGKLVITVSASQSQDWFHEPSKGWCYSEETLRKLCRLPEGVASNYPRKEELLDRLRREGCELHKRLAPVYFESGDNGMPWGKWDPRYQPVGVVKIRP